jgi:hypothetical protein
MIHTIVPHEGAPGRRVGVLDSPGRRHGAGGHVSPANLSEGRRQP